MRSGSFRSGNNSWRSSSSLALSCAVGSFSAAPSMASRSHDVRPASSFARCRSVPATALEHAVAVKRPIDTDIAALAGLSPSRLFAGGVAGAHQVTEDKPEEEVAPQSPRETFVVYSEAFWKSYARDKAMKGAFSSATDRMTGLRMGFAS
jgi:hypothetical protein